MTEKISLQSEGEQLDSFLDDLQREQQIREIAGWETGFPNLSRALDGIRPGLYLLVGPPGCGKTSFAKQLLDQVVMHNSIPGIFFSFSEKKKELRLKTLARLSGLENREIRRGSAYLLHWYGVPKVHQSDAEHLPPSWEKLKQSAEKARVWLDLIYLIECGHDTGLQQLENQVRDLQTLRSTDHCMIVIDDCQRLGNSELKLTDRLATVVDELQRTAVSLEVPIVAVHPDLGEDRSLPQIWSDKAPSADVILVVEMDLERTKKLTDPNQSLTFHIVKNRGGERGKLAFDFFPAFARFSEA
jgi:replicative DNA helicase